MKILFVTRGYPSKENPMIGNYEGIQAQALRKMGHRVGILYWTYRSPIHCKDFLKHWTKDDIEIFQATIINPLPYISRFIPKIIQGIYKSEFKLLFKKTFNIFGVPDVVHSHIVFTGYRSVLLKGEYNMPLILTEHWSEMAKSDITETFSEMGNIAYPNSDRVIAVSQSLADNISSKFNVKPTVVYNMVDDSFFLGKCTLPDKNKPFRFISVGSLRPVKGFDLLINAFAKCNFGEDVHLDIVGGGPEEENLRKHIESHGLQDKITLHGVKSPEDVAKLVDQANCYVMSSHAETFGIVLLEAMAKGKPLIATKCGGPQEFVTEECGYLVEPGSVDQLAEAMKKMLDTYISFNPIKIKEYCYNNFSQRSIGNQIVQIYQEEIDKLKNGRK